MVRAVEGPGAGTQESSCLFELILLVCLAHLCLNICPTTCLLPSVCLSPVYMCLPVCLFGCPHVPDPGLDPYTDFPTEYIQHPYFTDVAPEPSMSQGAGIHCLPSAVLGPQPADPIALMAALFPFSAPHCAPATPCPIALPPPGTLFLLWAAPAYSCPQPAEAASPSHSNLA